MATRNTTPVEGAITPTVRRLDTLPAVDHDYAIAGRTGLMLRTRVTRAGLVRRFRYRWTRDGKARYAVLADYPASSLAEVLALHGLAHEAARAGGDPAEVALRFRRERLGVSEPATTAAGPTVADCVAEFVAWCRKHRRSADHVEGDFRRHLPGWLAERPVATLRRRDLVQWLDGIPRIPTAHRVGALLKQAFSVAADRDLIEVLPAFPPFRKGAKLRPRTRVLTDAELSLLWHGLDALAPPRRAGAARMTQSIAISRPAALALKVQLLTATRSGELAAAEWRHFDLDGPEPTWRMPDTKSGRPFTAPLNALAVTTLRELRELAGASPFVLPALGATTAAPDRRRATARAARAVQTALKMEAWRPHDLRRTARTGYARLGVTKTTAEKLLNHASRDVLEAIYDQYAYATEMRAAADRWGGHVASVIAAPFTFPEDLKHLASRLT